ncbi:GumC family protein [Prochlorococcus sp. MIT 1341]|uniref:GumC family protein n=1 Tax=Prochlorococcus sp. MIT 1341 TaxID=3096221 RepID=UPI002A75AE5C|nr:Wzz/FepE/Etk N-terminal domain-containing protein [Prochlorococcus sp. MIT 1341]
MTDVNSKNVYNPNVSEEGGINFVDVVNFFRRRKFAIGLITLISSSISVVYAYTLPPRWEGSFQIVVSRKGRSSGGFNNPMAQAQMMNSLASIAGIAEPDLGSTLKTDLVILRSPSVLRPVYEFASELKDSLPSSGKMPTFKPWLSNNVTVKQISKTKALTIKYRDTEKRLIIPVLNRMKDAYQAYSNKDRSESLSNGIAYARSQIKIFKDKSNASNRVLDNFELLHGIRSSDKWNEQESQTALFQDRQNGGQAMFSLKSGIEGISGASSGATSSIKATNNPIVDLAKINRELLRRKRIFTENDPSIKTLIRERKAISDYIALSAGGSLASPTYQPRSKEEAQTIMLDYKELKRRTKRYQNTLNSLESMLHSLSLEQARSSQPWQLISVPTLVDEMPISPVKKDIALIGFGIGLLVGSLLLFIKEAFEGKIYLIGDIEKRIPGKLLQRLPVSDTSSWKGSIALILQGLFSSSEKGKVGLLYVGDVDSGYLKLLSKCIKDGLGGRELLISGDMFDLAGCSTQILVTSPGAITYVNLERIANQILLQKPLLAGWLLIDPYI